MVPVKIYQFAPYYKQKIRRVMKNIFTFVMLLLIGGVYEAHAQDVLQFQAGYLSDAAKAWSSIFAGLGPGAEVAAYVRETQNTNPEAFMNTISVLAFNSSAISLFEINSHINQAFSVVNESIISRRGTCTHNLKGCNTKNQNIILDGQVFGVFADYDSDKNGSFKTRNTGFNVSAKGFISDGWQLGIAYTRSMTDTHDNKVYTDAVSNSITLFTKYLFKNGIFMNLGLNGGHTSWTADKNLAGITDDSAYDTDFFAGQMTAGMRMSRGRLSMTPSIGVKYLRIMADKYADEVAQEFDKWWYNYLTGLGGIKLSFDFIGSDFVVRPSLNIGASYDIISNGTEELGVELINLSSYQIPIESPNRTALATGLVLDFYGEYFTAGISYRLDYRENYVAHTAGVKLNIAF